MTHELHLNNQPFLSIKSGNKTIEMRLFDEKRSKYCIDDILIFENRETSEKLKTKIINLHRFDSFVELYAKFHKIMLGYSINETADPKDMEIYYPIEEQEKYGVVGIEIEVIN
ncbi:MAG: ASCH domain-containing protein [Clostridia bacterium]